MTFVETNASRKQGVVQITMADFVCQKYKEDAC